MVGDQNLQAAGLFHRVCVPQFLWLSRIHSCGHSSSHWGGGILAIVAPGDVVGGYGASPVVLAWMSRIRSAYRTHSPLCGSWLRDPGSV